MASLVLLVSLFVSPKIKIHLFNVANYIIEEDASSLHGCDNELEEEFMGEKILQEPRYLHDKVVTRTVLMENGDMATARSTIAGASHRL
ncbi:hypothetical protein PIB30_090805, partial [Stylosanthes scabra]|nr:hypothetical protein [Stylosanthes scabra]